MLSGLMAQKEANYWYFGDYAGINFGLGVPLPLTNGALSTGEGCSAISTSAGNLQFYTDGRFAYDKTHNQMPNGYGLLGHSSSTQSGIIVPKPLSTTQYYIFTVDAWDNNLVAGVNYSRVDMTLNNGNGDVVVSEKNVPLVPLTCEKVTAVGHSDGVSIWVITHKWGTDEFYAYKVTSSGVNTTPVISHAGDPIVGDMQNSKGYLKLSPDGSWIAMANNTAFSVGIFHFSNTTGTVTHFATDNNYINPGGWDPGGPYGVEFSPNSKRLYIGEWKENRKIYQYDLSSNDPTTVLNSKTMVASVGQGEAAIGALQLGPDNRLYVARMNNPYLSRINSPNLLGTACGWEENAVSLAGRESTYGLPPFIQSFFYLTADFYWDNPMCFGTPSHFYTSASDDPDSVLWNFGDPASGAENTSTLLNPTHLYTSNGMHAVTLIVYLYGQAKNVFHIVIVNDPPDVYLGSDTTICSTVPYVLDADTGFATYLWQDGQTTHAIDVDTSGWYWCEVTNESGCPDRDSINIVFHYEPEVNAGPDKFIPSGTNTVLEGSVTGGSGNFTIHWEPAGLLIDPNVLQPTTELLSYSTLFTLLVTDNEGNCLVEDDVMVTITGGPLGCNPTADPAEICIGEQSQLLALISGGAGSYIYEWTSTPSGFFSDLENPVVAPLETTTYHLTVDDGFSTVNGNTILTVNELPVPNAGPDQSVIYNTPAMLFGGASGGSGTYIYHWEPGDKLLNPNIPQPTTVYLTEPTSFNLFVTDAQTGCVCEAPDVVVVNITGSALATNPTVMPGVVCAGEQAQLFAVAGGGTLNYSYEWTSNPPGFTSSQPDPYVTPNVTTTYTVTLSDDYNSVTGSVTLTVNPRPVINLGPDPTVCVFDTVIMDAGNPGPGSTYIWSNGSTEQKIKVATTGIGFDMKTYSVTVTSPEDCEASAERTVIFDFAACSGLGEPTESSLRIYPNPGNGLIKVENLAGPGSFNLSVTDMFGTKVIDNLPVIFGDKDKTFILDLTSEKPGLYLIRITENGKDMVAGKYLLTR